MKLALVLGCLFLSFAMQAQDSTAVKIHADGRIEKLIKKQIQNNEELTRNARKIDKGFRLLVISTTSREEVLAAKSKVYAAFPELKVYLFHQSPYYKLKAGNFKDRKEAESYQKRLEILFPKGVFIMNDLIEVKLPKVEEEQQL